MDKITEGITNGVAPYLLCNEMNVCRGQSGFKNFNESNNCWLCEMFVGFALESIASDFGNETNFLEDAEIFCTMVFKGSIQTDCKGAAIYVAEAVFQNGVNPDEVCKDAKWCPNSTISNLNSQQRTSLFYHLQKGQEESCETCRITSWMTRNSISNGDTELDKIGFRLEQVCNIFDVNCEKSVELVPQVVDLIVSGKRRVCKELGVCTYKR